MKLLITGGHFTPAMAVIEALKKRGDVEVVFVGRKYQIAGERGVSMDKVFNG